MAYGRLDVYWPDGKFETFALEGTSISVGRSTGNTITLDTDTISRYHISITLEDRHVFITDMDSANGTFVDAGRIESNQPRELRGGEEIQIGHLRMIYHATEDIPTLPMAALSDDTQRIKKDSVPFTVEVHNSPIAVPPGSHTSAELKITNISSDSLLLTVALKSTENEWFRVNRPQLHIDPDETASVLVSIKPARRPESKPGVYPVTVIIAMKDDPDKNLEALVNADIQGYSGFGMALTTAYLKTNEPFQLHLHNQGSVPLPLTVMGRSPNDTLRFGISTSQITLAPGQRQIVQGEIKPKTTRYIGAERIEPFELVVRSRDEAAFVAAAPGKFNDQPTMPTWAALTVAGSVVGIIALAILAVLLVINAPSPTPEIASFASTSTIITRGELITLNWETTNADHLNIAVDGVMVHEEIAPEPTTINVDSDAYEGTIVIVLEAVNDENVVTSSIAVDIEAPLTLDYFEVEPTTLVRNVVGNINLRWRINGATTTRVEGLQGFNTTTDIEPSFGAEAALNIPGIAVDNFAVTLYGEDAAGNVLTEVVNVDVISPECTADSDLTLYATPSSESNVVGTIGATGRVTVDGRDDSGAWLRVQLTGGVSGWAARTEMTCDDTFSVEALQIVQITLVPETTPDAPAPADNASG